MHTKQVNRLTPRSWRPDSTKPPQIETVLFTLSRGLKKKSIVKQYEAVSDRVTERVLREDKSHSIGLTMSDLHNRVPNEP